MRKFALITVILATVSLSAFAASAEFPIHLKPTEYSNQNLQVVNIYQLTQDSLTEIIKGESHQVVVEFPAHTKLPISFFLRGDLVHLVQNEENLQQIEIMQTFYVRLIGEELILSTNLIDWKPCLEFITGNASIGLNIQEGQPAIFVGAETNHRL